MDNINLSGSEDVLRASHNIQNAATQISRAAEHIDSALQDFERRMQTNVDEWLNRLEEILAKPKPEHKEKSDANSSE